MRKKKDSDDWVAETKEEIRVHDSLKYCALAFWSIFVKGSKGNYGRVDIPGTNISVIVGDFETVNMMISEGTGTGGETVG